MKTHDRRHARQFPPPGSTVSHRTFHDWSDRGSLTVTIAETLSDVDPDLDVPGTIPLYSTVDTTRLDGLFAPLSRDAPRNHGQVTFRYRDRLITVSATGTVTVWSAPSPDTWRGP